MQRHLKTHDKNKEKYMCDVASCRRVFSWPKDLKEPKKYDHGNFVFACSECDAKFRRPSAVKRHMKVRVDERVVCRVVGSTCWLFGFAFL